MSLRYIYTTLLLLSISISGFSQSIVTEFGKNRVQYHDDQYNWTRYETENFMTYWYGKSRNIAQSAIMLAELDHEEIQRVMEHTVSDKIEIIVYTDISDLRQTNIGSEQAFTSKADHTVVKGDKMMVYFDGDHQNLRKQIRRGIANIYLNSILYGSSLQEILQNALLLNLPAWYTDGIVAFAGDFWNHEIDDELRDLLSNKEYSDFEKLAEDHPRVAGQSMWNYIDKQFGTATIANIIYLTRISRDLGNSFLFITGVEYSVLKNNWYSHYRSIYQSEASLYTATDSLSRLELQNGKGVPVSSFRFSSDGNSLAYVVNDRSKVRVVVRDMKTGEEKVVLKNGSKNLFQETDFAYPLIAWHPTYPELTILYEHRDIAKLRVIDLKDDSWEEDDLTTNFQRVFSISYLKKDEYILSASTDGYSDLYHYNSDRRHHKRITEDYHDDLEASVINYKGKSAVLFSSNRTDLSLEKNRLDTILPISNYDLYILDGTDKDAKLIQITKTKNISERQAYQADENKIVYLHSISGIQNAYAYDLSSDTSHPITNAERNIILHHSRGNSLIYNYYHSGNYKNFLSKISGDPLVVTSTKHGKETINSESDIKIPFLPESTEVELTEGMKFQSPFDDVEDLQSLDDSQIQESNSLFDKYFKDYYSGSFHEGRPIIKFNPMRASASRERFRLDNFESRMDNEVLFEGLESYTGEDKELNANPVGFLMKAEVTDLLEDHKISIGLRVPTRFNGYEYFVTIDNDKRLWDKRAALYRKSVTEIIDENFPIQREKRHVFLGMYRLKYPFDVYKSLRFTGSMRFDKYFNPVSDLATLENPLSNEKRLSLKAEFVYDNSHEVSINILNGTRAKVYSEFINEFDLQLKDNLAFSPSTGRTGVFGFDARHYIPVFKRAVIALRGAGATSLGSKRIVYYLGGVEGWILSSTEQDIPTPGDNGNAYKTQAPQLRGFKNNIRNGNSYLLANAEFRFPIGQFIGFRKSRFAFFRNLQLAGFTDGGLAWYGAVVDDEDNPLNTVIVENPTTNPIITVEARYFRDPLVYGYGVGFRSTMLGYFVKFDYAWGVETGVVRSPQVYLSLGKDF